MACAEPPRSGYVPLLLYDFTAARLERAGLFVSIGPSRSFSPAERAHIRRFVERGGLISMVGAEEADASAALLEDFSLRSCVTGANHRLWAGARTVWPHAR